MSVLDSMPPDSHVLVVTGPGPPGPSFGRSPDEMSFYSSRYTGNPEDRVSGRKVHLIYSGVRVWSSPVVTLTVPGSTPFFRTKRENPRV